MRDPDDREGMDSYEGMAPARGDGGSLPDAPHPSLPGAFPADKVEAARVAASANGLSTAMAVLCWVLAFVVGSLALLNDLEPLFAHLLVLSGLFVVLAPETLLRLLLRGPTLRAYAGCFCWGLLCSLMALGWARIFGGLGHPWRALPFTRGEILRAYFGAAAAAALVAIPVGVVVAIILGTGYEDLWRRLREREVGFPMLLDFLAPGLGSFSQGRVWHFRALTPAAVAAAHAVLIPVLVPVLAAVYVAGWCFVLSQGYENLRIRQLEEIDVAPAHVRPSRTLARAASRKRAVPSPAALPPAAPGSPDDAAEGESLMTFGDLRVAGTGPGSAEDEAPRAETDIVFLDDDERPRRG